MATLHKFKLLATQCTVTRTPTQSPTASPVFHIRRRRKTLRMLLSGAADRRERFPRRDEETELQQKEDPPEKRVRRKLKDLFVSSPPLHKDDNRDGDEVDLFPVNGSVAGGGGGGGGGSGGCNGNFAARRGGASALRAVSTTFRYRLLKRAWRPVLVTIPEQ